MKKIPLFLIILVPLMIAAAIVGVIFGVKLIGVDQDLTLKSYQLDDIESIPAAEKVTTYQVEKTQAEYDKHHEESLYDTYATYKYGNTTFISYSPNWGEANLQTLCEELYKNKHGDEINYLDEVVVYDLSANKDYDDYVLHYEYSGINSSFYNLIPEGTEFYLPYIKSEITLEYGYDDNSPEYMALKLSREYGKYFTQYYFNILGDKYTIESDEYFKLRYDNNNNIRYTPSDLSDSTDYYEKKEWYLFEIAAADYVYLLGSPTTKLTSKYIDSLQEIKLDVANKEEEIEKYAYYNEGFNKEPHLNIQIPLPDQIDGLPELFFSKINASAPEYDDHTKEAENIDIVIKKQSEYGKYFYAVTWNKPWDDKDVMYTLVAYNEDEWNWGAIKSIYGNERARAIIGGATFVSGRTLHYYETDRWKEEGYLKFRVIVTFSDGTAVVSPSVEWSFE